jgi:hypothetical protein
MTHSLLCQGKERGGRRKEGEGERREKEKGGRRRKEGEGESRRKEGEGERRERRYIIEVNAAAACESSRSNMNARRKYMMSSAD